MGGRGGEGQSDGWGGAGGCRCGRGEGVELRLQLRDARGDDGYCAVLLCSCRWKHASVEGQLVYVRPGHAAAAGGKEGEHTAQRCEEQQRCIHAPPGHARWHCILRVHGGFCAAGRGQRTAGVQRLIIGDGWRWRGGVCAMLHYLGAF